MPNSPAEEVAPNAGNLIESLRDFGYTLQSALADLIDNSLTADATKIDVTVHAARTTHTSLWSITAAGWTKKLSSKQCAWGEPVRSAIELRRTWAGLGSV